MNWAVMIACVCIAVIVLEGIRARRKKREKEVKK